jgi:hypothetical protein
MNRITFLFERFSLIPAFSRWEKENYSQLTQGFRLGGGEGR